MIRLVAGVLGLALLVAVAASAQPASGLPWPGKVAPVRLRIMPGSAEIVVQGITLLRLRGEGAEARAAEILRRLLEAILRPPYAVSLAARPGAVDLLLNGRHLATADPVQAAAAGTTLEMLAQTWAARLTQALSRNTVALVPDLLVLRPGQVSVARVYTFIPSPITFGPYDERIAAARESGGTITVEGRGVGSTVIPVIAGGGQGGLQVVVRREAGAIPDDVIVYVTGTPPSPALIREAIERRIDQLTVRQPGSTLQVGPLPPFEEEFPAEGEMVVTVPVRLKSPYNLPVERETRVTVVRRDVTLVDPQLLLVSNRPEAVNADGVLFQEVVDARHATRLLYHHQNATPSHARILWVALSNRAAQPAAMLMIAGMAGPSADPVYVGHIATARFLQNLAATRGYVLELPPRSTYAFTVQSVAPMQLVSGLLQFQLLSGEELEVKVQIRSPWLLERTVTSAVNQAAYPHPKGTFQQPTVDVQRAIDLPGPPVRIVDLGTTARLVDIKTGDPLVGDYGVVYRLTLTLANRAPRDVVAELVGIAAGGLARGVLLVDGQPVDLALLRPNEERALTAFSLHPGETIDVRILTMPAAGSYYPLRLLMRTRE